MKNCKVRDDSIRSSLLKLLQSDLPYRAHEFALESLGYQSNPEDIPILLKHFNMNDPHHLIQSGGKSHHS